MISKDDEIGNEIGFYYSAEAKNKYTQYANFVIRQNLRLLGVRISFKEQAFATFKKECDEVYNEYKNYVKLLHEIVKYDSLGGKDIFLVQNGDLYYEDKSVAINVLGFKIIGSNIRYQIEDGTIFQIEDNGDCKRICVKPLFCYN